jgi:hypothetical protein
MQPRDAILRSRMLGGMLGLSTGALLTKECALDVVTTLGLTP